MSEKYLRQNRNSYTVVKNSRVFGKFESKDEAIFARDILVENNWKTDEIDDEIFEADGKYMVFKVIDNKLCYLGEFNEIPHEDMILKLAKRHIRNPNNSRYGLNITKLFDTFIIKKQIAGDEYIFGLFDSLEDATFSRNFLMDHNWDVGEFGEIEYCDETDTYKIVEVIDDRIYILATYESEVEAKSSLDDARHEFLNKISKHKNGLANYPHLDVLTDSIENLENRFQMKTSDEVWNFHETQNPLEDIIFNLTPWQKIIYDAAGDEFSFKDLEKSLARYKSKNFDKKIRKYLNQLIDLGLVEKLDDDVYKRL
ncbi:hypothetical protein [uncultured Methanobrevibacter sp.]|uniref:hypothetical protein n=1 Tax=uncultured Methanobrevibacter sp. TaxID=253161 RepID=UPI0025E72BC0|nr:hypothetical protein [uncultured Methanobrevibacter sp.]